MTTTLLQIYPNNTPSSGVETIILTIIVTLGAGGIFKLVQMWVEYIKQKQEKELAPVLEYKDSLKQRVVELELNLDELRMRIEELITMYSEKILVLSTEKATLLARNEALTNENTTLREELARNIKN